jgi:Zn-dependent M28 family amino/carboxypeptidase
MVSSVRTSLKVGFATVLLVTSIDCVAQADDIVGRPPVSGRSDLTTGEGAFRHLQALQEIATASGGNRAAGTVGYDRSAQYVADRLREAGYAVRFEEFEFPFFEEKSPPVLLLSKPDSSQEPASANAVRTLASSGSREVEAHLRAVNLQLSDGSQAASVSGCEGKDFDGFERGSVALVRRGTCQFQVKVDNAVAAGAAGVIIMNEGTDGRTDAFSGVLSKGADVPVVGVSYEFGRLLAGRTGDRVRLAVNAVTGKRVTRNVLADMGANSGVDDKSAKDPLIVAGAHLDSVTEGPGINDNGSGSAAVLEAALRLAQEPAQNRGRMRFAFWGAEERGLVGSRHHVSSLSDDERRRIAVYVNLDMVGSPNFTRFVRGSVAKLEGLAAIVREEIVTEFRTHDLPFEERSGGGTGSDDASFFQKGIPTVGLYTGASGKKPESEAKASGGVAGRPYDPCYHRACDTVENINREVLEQHTQVLVRALRAAANPARTPSASVPEAVDLPGAKQ